MLVEYGETKKTTYPNQTFLWFGIDKSLMLIFMIFYVVPLSSQELEIRLVDGRNGHPMVGTTSYVNAWVGTERKEAIVIPTDRDGNAKLLLTLDPGKVNIPDTSNNSGSIIVANPVVKYNESFRINVPYALCGSGGSNYSWLMLRNFSTKQVLEHGYVSPNTCGKTMASPKPGQVILFVRPLSWWEKFKQ